MIAAAFTPRGLFIAAALKLALSIATMSGCTTSQLRTHAHAASLSRASLDLGASLGEAACSTERSAQMGRDGVSSAEHEAHVRRCERVRGSHALAAASWLAYVRAVLASAETGRTSMADVLTWASRLVATYRDFAAALGAMGVDVPRLPAALGGE